MKRISTLNKNLSKTLNEMYYAVQNYILKHQGEKGYIDAQSGNEDTMHFYAHDNEDITETKLVEGRICAIRVKEGNIQILGTIFNNIVFTEDDIKNITNITDNIDNANGEYNPYLQVSGEWEEFWQNVHGNDTILYVQTIISIAESIEQYE